MPLSTHFISIDWGTTNFRLRVVETQSLRVVFHRKNQNGVRGLYNQYLNQKVYSQAQFFANYLLEQLENVPQVFRSNAIVAAGMASSSIGLHDIPYGRFPFDQSGTHLPYICMPLEGDYQLLLIGGVKDDAGMMRGEETQAIGLAPDLSQASRAILLLPGTHSKHLVFEGGQFQRLQTYMTGELFELLSQQSILRNSVVSSTWNKTTALAFMEGLERGIEDRLSVNLFHVRSRHVLRQDSKMENFYFLSGLLIGDELAAIRDTTDHIFLATTPPILQLYKLALEAMFPIDQLTVFDQAHLERAFLDGQRKILERHVNAQ